MTNIQSFEACIKACQQATVACHECAGLDIAQGGTANCALICFDCAEVCSVAAGSMARGSAHYADICALCAHLCRQCAAACAVHAATSEACARCARACEQCAMECDKHASGRQV